MKTKSVKFVKGGKPYAYDVAIFESYKEAQTLLGVELLNVINLGNALYAKAQALGKNPFKPRKTRARIDLTKLDELTIQKLTEAGAFVP